MRRLITYLITALVVAFPAFAQLVSTSPAVETRSFDESIFRFLIDCELTISSAFVLEDMWQVGGLINLDLADGTITVVSDNANDTLAGTGARRIVLRGNTSEAFPQFQSVEIDMDGTTPVVTVESFQGFSLAQARVILSDDLQRQDLPTGTITITQSGSTVGVILSGEMQTRHCFRRIPYGPNGQVQTWDIIAGDLSIRDLAGKADATAAATLWTFSPGDQAHTDGGTTIQAATSPIALLLLSTFDSGESFSLRLLSDQSDVEFFANLVAKVTVKRIGPVLIVHDLQ